MRICLKDGAGVERKFHFSRRLPMRHPDRTLTQSICRVVIRNFMQAVWYRPDVFKRVCGKPQRVERRSMANVGGYMILGESVQDVEGVVHPMLDLLPLETSFAKRKLQLGYRVLEPLVGSPWMHSLSAHEFHYASILHEGKADRLFRARDAVGDDLGEVGLRVGTVSGSFMHVIDFCGEKA
jgi:hypothetical protein